MPSVTIFPGEELTLLGDMRLNNQIVAVEPRMDSSTFRSSNWPSCRFVSVIDGDIRLTNDTAYPIRVPRNDYLVQIRSSVALSSRKQL